MSSRPILLIAALSAGLVIVAHAQSFTAPPGSPLAGREHPRLLITSASLPAVRAKLGSGGVWQSDFRAWVGWADGQYGTWHSLPDKELQRSLHNYAFIWLTHPVAGVSYGRSKADYGAAAKAMLMKFVGLYPKAGNMESYQAALAYDWIYPLLTSSERAALGGFFKGIDDMGMTDPPRNPFNAQVAMARSQKLIGALAMFGDGIDDAWANAALARYGDYFSDPTGVTRSESDLGGDEGSMSEGNAYALTYTLPSTILAEEGWRTANALPAAAFYLAPGRTFIRRLPQYFAGMVLPWAVPTSGAAGGRRYVLAKTQRAAANLGAGESPNFALLVGVAGLLKGVDPQTSGLAQWLIDNRVGGIPVGDVYNGRWPAIWKFILGDRATPVHPSAAGMGLSLAHKEGKWVFRTGWDSPSDSYVTFRANRWIRNTGGMSPNHAGGFTIDRNGPQVTFQGGNDGHDWGSGSSLAGNMLIFPDATQAATTGIWDDEGGHRILPGDSSGSATFLPRSAHDAREITRFMPAGAGRDVDYVYADLTRSYNSTQYKDDYNPARVSAVVREFVYFRPANADDTDRVVVFDRASTTATKFEKRWLYHTSGEPSVNGTVQVGRPVRNGSGAGKWTYTGATRVTATNTLAGSNGRAFLTPLLPASRLVVKVGGPNSAGLSWQSDSHEYEDAYGVTNKGNAPLNADTAQYVGQYRIEIIPSVPTLTDVFLNVIEVGNAGLAAPRPTGSLAGTGLVAARVGDRIAIFNRLLGDITTGDITNDVSGTYGVHISDLTPRREYQISVGGTVATHAASAAGTLYLTLNLPSGTRIDVRATGVVVDIAPGPPTNVRIVR